MNNEQNINFTPARQRSFEDVGFIDVDLSVARTKPESLGLAGRTIFIGTQAYDDKYTISSSLTVGQALLTLNEPNGNPIEAIKGMFYDFSTKENEVGVFNDVYIRNTAQANKMMRIFFTTQTQIKPFSTELEISDTDTHTKLDTIETSLTALENLLQNNTELRAGMIDLSNASFATVNSGTTNIVLAGANTNGVAIYCISGESGNGYVTIEVDGGNWFRSNMVEGMNMLPIILPSGVDVKIKGSTSGQTLTVVYEVL